MMMMMLAHSSSPCRHVRLFRLAHQRVVSVRSYHASTGPKSSYSRMLDMGGAPGAATTKNNVRLQNASKNSKVQAVAFDFELLVKAIHHDQDDLSPAVTTTTSSSPKIQSSTTTVITPDTTRIEEVASLLKVDLSGQDGVIQRISSEEEDDLSALIGKKEGQSNKSRNQQNSDNKKSEGIPKSLQDIRAKYANKLHKKGVDGGIASVELLNYQRDEALKRGDAEGHWAARKIAMGQPQQSSGASRWMALTGTGNLLSTLTHRSMKIALLPRPNNADSHPQQMVDLTKQLKDVVFDVLIELPKNDNSQEASMVKTTLEKLALDPKVILFVSDQDSFLREAKDLGMMTCRIRPLNARRGNVSAHYTVETVLQVQDIVNEMNGISFNAVLNM
ncbi:expressed unknown protein [Seminavis robusta]|uniref:Uncharacterized protein n=1 Tax=Seminavis robusta TaxID=568900 RepID=A0A9N8D625_9STRA|nr:expressed unknown protein [Seminavis robusta]|eukprot:Sro15_g010860.1 n/a (389) ;mRNA; r:14734-15900